MENRQYGNVSKRRIYPYIIKGTIWKRREGSDNVFWFGGKPKTTLEEMGKDFDLTVEDVLQIKNDGIRKFINMIVSTENYPITIPDGFLESADSEFLDNFMRKFIGSN